MARKPTARQWLGLWRVARQVEQWSKRPRERFLRWEGLGYQPQATAFPFVAAEGETKKRLLWLVGQLPATAFPFVAAVIGTERRLPRLASQLLATAFSSVAAEFEAVKRLPRLASQLPAMAFPFVAAVVGPHLGGLSEGQAEQGLQSHWSRQYGRGVVS